MADPTTPSWLDAAIVAPTRTIGDAFQVRRALPTRERRMVGPFVFLDHMGPLALAPGQGADILPHPHVGLSTVTYLFEGEILHRDSLGTVQRIAPGDVNWMTAGRGIVHSERTPAQLRPSGSRMTGLQLWVALRREEEDCAPSFVHHAASELPQIASEGRRMRVIAGSYEGVRSPVESRWETLFVDAILDPGARMPLPADVEELAFYVASGEVAVEPDEGAVFEEGRLVVVRPGARITVRALSPARIAVVGGASSDGPRHIRWNFVSSSIERLDQASEDWDRQQFAPIPGESGFVPLPDYVRAQVRHRPR